MPLQINKGNCWQQLPGMKMQHTATPNAFIVTHGSSVGGIEPDPLVAQFKSQLCGIYTDVCKAKTHYAPLKTDGLLLKVLEEDSNSVESKANHFK